MNQQPPYNPYYAPGQTQPGWQYPGQGYPQGGYGQPGFDQSGYPPYPAPPPAGYGQPDPGYGGSGHNPVPGSEDQKYSFGFSDHSIRQGFIRKVFLILSGQLLVVTAMIALFTYHTGTKLFVRQNTWLHWMALVVFMATYIAIGCCTNVRRRYPGNMICLVMLTLALGYMTATTASFYDTESVVIAAVISFLACLGVSLFAMQTKYDFTSCMGVMCVVGIVLFFFGIICAIFTVFMKTPILMIVYAGFGALVFMIYLAIDIQMVIGGKRLELSPEDYVFAAVQLLVDVVYIFIYLLQIIGYARE